MDAFHIIVPDGPVVQVHKGWNTQAGDRTLTPLPKSRKLQRSEIGSEHDSSRTGRQFQFVNASKPGRNRDPEVRKLVRKHVRNEHVRKTLSSNTDRSPQGSAASPVSNYSDSADSEESLPDISPPRNIGYGSALLNFDFPITMSPTIHRYLDHYLTHAPRMLYPLESCLRSNPLRSPAWFQYATQDDAMFHAILYAGSLYLALLEGKTETKDSNYHFGNVVSIVNQRLGDLKEDIEDSTIGAISCLALGEALKGNKALWQTHMLGIKHMINSRRNLSPISSLLIAKLRRFDIVGAIDYAATPLLEYDRSPKQTIWFFLSNEKLNAVGSEMRNILSRSNVHPRLIEIFVELAFFSEAIEFAPEASIYFDPTTFSEDLYWLEYSLLSFPQNLPKGSRENEIDKACRLGALLYLKAVLQEIPHSKNGSKLLLSQLQQAMVKITISKTSSYLLLWLSLVGGSIANGEMRSWFVDYLVQIRRIILVVSFDDSEVEMSQLLGLNKIFRRAFETLWDETMLRSGIIFDTTTDSSQSMPLFTRTET